MELDGEIRDVVGQLTADETNRHRAVRQIGDRTRDAGHLLGIGHLELRTERRRRRKRHEERPGQRSATPECLRVLRGGESRLVTASARIPCRTARPVVARSRTNRRPLRASSSARDASWRRACPAASPDRARSGRGTRCRRRADASAATRARAAGPTSRCQSESDSFPIARSNSSSLIDRSASIFSRSSATRVRWPIIDVESSSGETSGRSARSTPRPTSAVAPISTVSRTTAVIPCPRLANSAAVAQPSAASTKNCHGWRLLLSRCAFPPSLAAGVPASFGGSAEALRAEADSRTASVEVSELIVESFFEGRIGRR